MDTDIDEINKTEKMIVFFKFSMRLLSLAYFIGALFFFFIPDGVNYILNFLPIFLKVLQPLPDKNVDYFWLPLVGSLMFVLTYIAFQSSRDPHNKILLNVHILSKLISALGYFYLFVVHAYIFGYIVGGVLDFAICCFVLYLKIKIQNIPKNES